jgi:hypothetical protein
MADSDTPREPVDPVGIQILDHVLIRDKQTGTILVNKNGQIKPSERP